MIELYSGTPGSGKSYHAALRIIKRFERGGGLICNFPVSVPKGYAQSRIFVFLIGTIQR